jgi:predicted RNase H-like HicB family nuclease
MPGRENTAFARIRRFESPPSGSPLNARDHAEYSASYGHTATERYLDRKRPGGPMPRYHHVMRNEFTAIIERDGDFFIAYCPEVPGANGQGQSREAAIASLGEAISLILEDRRQDALRGLPQDAIRETITVG